MKFSLTLIALAAVAAQAASVKPTNAHHDAEPTAVFEKGIGHCEGPGGKCAHARRAAEAVAEAFAEADAKKSKLFTMCGVIGSSCSEKRHYVKKVNDQAYKTYRNLLAREAEAKKNKYKLFTMCGVVGSSCSEKRAIEMREAEAEAEAKKSKLFTMCGVIGSSCSEKRSAEADPRKKSKLFTMCGVIGSSCSEKRAEQERAISDAIKAWEPETFKEECYAEGNECHAIVQAAKAFNRVKREIEAEAAEPAAVKLAVCKGDADCGVYAKNHLQAAAVGHPAAARGEAECDAEDGFCTLAARDLQDLEDSLNEAVASLNED